MAVVGTGKEGPQVGPRICTEKEGELPGRFVLEKCARN